MTIRMMAGMALCKKIDLQAAPLLKEYDNILTDEERRESGRVGAWLTIHKAARRLTEDHESVDTLKVLAGKHLFSVLDKKLEDFCNFHIKPIISEFGETGKDIWDQWEEGLITESECLMKLIDVLSEKEES